MFVLVVFNEGRTSIRRLTKLTNKEEAIDRYYKFKDETYCELWYTRYQIFSIKEIKKIAKAEGIKNLKEVEYALIAQATSRYERILPFKHWVATE